MAGIYCHWGGCPKTCPHCQGRRTQAVALECVINIEPTTTMTLKMGTTSPSSPYRERTTPRRLFDPEKE